MNLIPFPRLHFYVSGLAPLDKPNPLNPLPTTVLEFMNQLTVGRSFIVNCNPNQGRYFTMAAMMRGNFSLNEVEMEFANMQQKKSASFVPWVPNSVTISCCTNPPLGKKRYIFSSNRIYKI
jgi:tubulin beta